MKMRVADYIAETLAQHGIDDVFLVTGGGAMHLNDAFARCKKFRYTCCHHEQSCAIAAEAYARVTGRPAAVNVTSGPGGTNAVTGVFCAWVDSIPMIVVSGQVRRSTLLQHYGLVGQLRQLGDQEVDIVSMVRGITKYAVTIEDPESIRYHLERAMHLAVAGRPGPCWIDVPVDVQGTMIDPETLVGYEPAEDAIQWETSDLSAACDAMLAKLCAAERPVIYAGSGIRLSGAYEQFLKAIDLLGIPVATAWDSIDLLWDEHPLYVGRPGSQGNRSGNFAVQNADVLLTLGCRLNIRQVTPNWENFARAAFRIMVDIDAEEMRKPSCKVHLPIHADVSDVFRLVIEKLQKTPMPRRDAWIAWCKDRQAKYPVVLPEYWNTKQVNPYCFMKTFFEQLDENAIVVSGNGTACVTAFQAARIRRGQRLFHNSGCAPMGYDLPGAIGAAIAKPGQDVFCITGDGSIMMNLQELQTIVGKRLPIKIFVLNNTGYHSIRQTQANFFPDNPIGCGVESGVTFPDFGKMAAAFDIPFFQCRNHAELTDSISKTAATSGPAMCEVMLDLSQAFAPKASAKRLPDGRIISVPLEDMSPFLNREELLANMLIPTVSQ